MFEAIRRLRSCPGTWLVILLIVSVQAGVWMAGGLPRLTSLYETLGLGRIGFFPGKVWQLFTYGFLHGGWGHALVNALCVLMLAPRVEQVLGAGGLARVAIAGILAGGIFHLAMGGSAGTAALLVGFSGACVALLLVLTTLSPDSRMWPIPVSGRALGAGVLIAEFLLAVANPGLDIPAARLVGGWLVSVGLGDWFEIGHACHFGGGLAGWLIGRWTLRNSVSLDSLRRDRARREAEERQNIN